MKYLHTSGLSKSQAESISNICNQKVVELDRSLSKVNNFSSTITVNNEKVALTNAHPIPSDVIDTILMASKYRAVQAHLMEAIKASDVYIKNATNQYHIDVGIYDNQLDATKVVIKQAKYPILTARLTEKDAWETLSSNEIYEFRTAEAHASTIGKFIHKGGKLDELREDLGNFQPFSWHHDSQGNSYPVLKEKHHNPEDLFEIHEKLAKDHRKYESRVNYFKAKVKNLVAFENRKIDAENTKLLEAYSLECIRIRDEERVERERIDNAKITKYNELASIRDTEINRISKLRIVIPSELQPVIDEILNEVGKEEV